MQKRVARQLPRLVTVSTSSKTDITAQMGVPADKLGVVAVGVDHERFRRLPHIKKVPGRLMTTASADVPLKGLMPLLEAVAKVKTERSVNLTHRRQAAVGLEGARHRRTTRSAGCRARSRPASATTAWSNCSTRPKSRSSRRSTKASRCRRSRRWRVRPRSSPQRAARCPKSSAPTAPPASSCRRTIRARWRRRSSACSTTRSCASRSSATDASASRTCSRGGLAPRAPCANTERCCNAHR